MPLKYLPKASHSNGQYMQLLGSKSEPLETFPATAFSQAPQPEIFPAPPRLPLITSPTKRVRAVDTKERSCKWRAAAKQPEKPEPIRGSVLITPNPASAAQDAQLEVPWEGGSGQLADFDLPFGEYADAVILGSAGFIQVSSDLCAVQGWDSRRSEATNQTFRWLLRRLSSSSAIKVLLTVPAKLFFQLLQGVLLPIEQLSLMKDQKLRAQGSGLALKICGTHACTKVPAFTSNFLQNDWVNPQQTGIFLTVLKWGQKLHSKSATLYTLWAALACCIEVQACPNCPPHWQHFIGPDLREQGIFNLNNSMLASHELLNEYTNAFTLSETPFDSWVQFLRGRYEEAGSKFMGKDQFRSCWFAFARLQKLESDFLCPDCGKQPENVIWDGVTLAFHQRQLLSTIQPPTTTFPESPLRPTKYIPSQQVLPNPALRKLLRNLTSPADRLKSTGQPGAPLPPAAEPDPETVSTILAELHKVNPSLAAVFQAYFTSAAREKSPVPQAVQSFFFQLAAEESILQMINRPSQAAIDQFLSNPRKENEYLLCSCPHLFHLLQLDQQKHGGLAYSALVLSVLQWLLQRSRSTLKLLSENSPPLLDDTSYEAPVTNWERTGCFYSMPQIRIRPAYPHLAGENIPEDRQQRGGKCSKDPSNPSTSNLPSCGKYFSTYGQQGLTGGIMVVWCTHSISYSFHCIPKCEGRNDVFSAMVTRWPRAPKRVVYDFSCALGPYCLLREPDFFADTLFIIDTFHARDHTKCAPACFAQTYSNVDPDVTNINTSAAESGNSAILRIRKAVSYMSQH
ncbi:hypothetical protein NP233_g12574 [Leucocoprinus birnbaumii]|uniref:HMG domain-containing protein n=1 Tax=Leucocoprinus birnbaumii TaxID=56174 RepID=A0AAD5VES7_9AGAR|nr:hypothetical protein NP233_g12574 [Leucocoprinus birnbaumii]